MPISTVISIPNNQPTSPSECRTPVCSSPQAHRRRLEDAYRPKRRRGLPRGARLLKISWPGVDSPSDGTARSRDQGVRLSEFRGTYQSTRSCTQRNGPSLTVRRDTIEPGDRGRAMKGRRRGERRYLYRSLRQDRIARLFSCFTASSEAQKLPAIRSPDVPAVCAKHGSPHPRPDVGIFARTPKEDGCKECPPAQRV